MIHQNYTIITKLLKISIIAFVLLLISLFLIYDSVAKAETKSYEGEYCNTRRECAEGLVCDGNADHPDSDGICVQAYRENCIQIQQAAYDVRTERCKVFSTPCHIPPDWQEVNSCKKDCLAIQQPAFNSDTGECQVFENTCDVPVGWKKIASCAEACEDVKQNAFSQRTGECREFTSQCDIPAGWLFVKSCDRDFLRVCGGPDYIPCRYGDRCLIDEDLEDAYGICESERDDFLCIQMIQPAYNPRSGECREFSTPCDVPYGWVKTDFCESEPLPPPDYRPRDGFLRFDTGTGNTAVDPHTGECKDFSTPMDIPSNWVQFDSCEEVKDYFSDTVGHWAMSYIKQFKDRGVIEGKRDGKFEPDSFVTRAEGVKIILKALEIEEGVCDPEVFKDVHPDSWYCGLVRTAKDKGLVQGENNYFYPHRLLTRAEAVKILLKAKGIYLAEEPRISNFRDVPIGSWYSKYINKAFDLGYVKGKRASVFEPESFVTRAELVKMAAIAGGYEE